MTKYVDADALWKRLPNDLPYKASVKRVLIQAPAADVRPVVRGRWIVHDFGAGDISYECSECKEISCCGADFCPDCGADMRESIADEKQ